MVWDLKKDWSDTANPNGVWSLKEGDNLIPALTSGWQVLAGWSEAQLGFAEAATGNQRIPFWYRSNGSETFSPDNLEGDIVLHTSDEFSGTGNGPASVVWTSPISGTVSILGGVWMTRDIGRANDWKLYHNGSLFRNGSLSSGDAYNRACPFRFENGVSPGAPGPFNMIVAVGDEIKLEIVRSSAPGDFVGVDLRIVAGSVWQGTPGANRHAYLPVKTPAGITWQEAEADAVARGGHLASISSAGENAFVFALVGSRPEYWYPNTFNCQIGPFIGGHQPDGSPEPNGGWQWTDGTPFTYTNWYPGEPNNSGNLEKYAHLFNCGGPPASLWNDVSPPVTALGYIVEYGTDPDQPQGPEFADMLYVASQTTNTVLQYRLAPTGTPQLLRTLTEGMNKPSGLALDATNTLFVVQRGNQGAGDAKVSRWPGAEDTPAFAGFLPPAIPALDYAHGVALQENALLVVDSNRNQVRRFLPDGTGAFNEQLPALSAGIAGTFARFVAVHPVSGEVSASAPELPPLCVPGTMTSVSEGLIGWWKGDGDALDFTGKHPGTAENAVTYEPGRFGQAFSLGSNPPAPNSPRSNLGHLPELKGTDAWTISAWIKVPAISPGLFWLGLPVGNIAAGSGAPYYGRGLWAAASSAPGSFHPQFFQFSNTVNYSATVPPFPAETWTHAVGVWRSADGFQGTYINGNLTNSGLGTPGAKFPDGSGDLVPAYIGALGFVTGSTTTVNNSYPCLFDDVRIYDRALSAEEIALIASGQDFNTCAPSDTGHPPLTATKVPAGVRLSWPSRYTGWALESSPELQTWAPVPGTPLLESGEFTVTTPLTGPRHSFRLRRQP